jgi:hypothetical protein
MNIEQALATGHMTQLMHSHYLVLGDNVEIGQRNQSRQTHGGRVDFPFVMKLISIIFTNIDLNHLLNFTIVEPGSGDGTFSLTIWSICHYIFQSTPRIFAIEIDHARHAASQLWLQHHITNCLSLNASRYTPTLLCDDFCRPTNPTISRIFANHRKVISFVNNACGCLHGDPTNSPQHILETQLDECMNGSIVVTMDTFFCMQKNWKEEIFSIPIVHSDISWLSQRRPDKPGRMIVFKYTKMPSSQYSGTGNRPRYHTSNVVYLNEFSIGF